LKSKDTYCPGCGLARVQTSRSFDLTRLAFWLFMAAVASFAIYTTMLAASRC
jgi:hypothetical protein